MAVGRCLVGESGNRLVSDNQHHGHGMELPIADRSGPGVYHGIHPSVQQNVPVDGQVLGRFRGPMFYFRRLNVQDHSCNKALGRYSG